MTQITHHIPDPVLLSYASGALPHPFALVVAAHVSLCDECRARLGAHQAAGGMLLESSVSVAVSDTLKDRLLDKLAGPESDAGADQPAPFPPSGPYPAPVMQALDGCPPKWKSLGLGVRQSILHDGSDGNVRLLYIPAGRAMPKHGHNGLEMTLVLQGAFYDDTGHFAAGDVELADTDLDHQPVAGPDGPCICLAATDAPLRFHSWIPRLLQPFLRI